MSFTSKAEVALRYQCQKYNRQQARAWFIFMLGDFMDTVRDDVAALGPGWNKVLLSYAKAMAELDKLPIMSMVTQPDGFECRFDHVARWAAG
ncbi:MAG: hypothetical protein GZ085_09775 [Sulfuriferula multivorans]|uniref:Uncharacterized protein n=1 Tax=Sulfuriferula multivorans TaxID=1559896 RepID=A0A7C9JXT2_9PROT|nr:hypothetical protein [Sulfuriferula multivorans]